MKVTIKNDRVQPLPYTITDRPVEVKTTSLGAAPDTIPPMSIMTVHFRDGDVLTFTPEGGIVLKNEAEAADGS